MQLNELKKAIASAAYALRKGDESKRKELASLREKHRELAGVAQPKAPELVREESKEQEQPEVPVEAPSESPAAEPVEEQEAPKKKSSKKDK